MEENIIVIKQLPVIEENCKKIKAKVQAKVDKALSLVCNDDTVKIVKKERAELNKDFVDWEKERKIVKNKIMSPYEKFEVIYNECIANVFKKADIDLKKKIDDVENETKQKKEIEIKFYFDEYLKSKLIDFVTFENANINVTLSASEKSLKDQAKDYIDEIVDDLALIDTQDDKIEILVEYKKDLNVSKAITAVKSRKKAIEEAKNRALEIAKKQDEQAETVAKVEEIAPIQAPISSPIEEVTQENILKMTFTVKATIPKLKQLKNYLENEGYDYE